MAYEKRRLWSWSNFEIVDKKSCERAIQYGAGFAIISGGISACFGIASFFIKPQSELTSIVLDPWVITDAVFIWTLAFFILRKSRSASVILMAHFLLSKLIMWAQLGFQVGGLVISVAFFLYYFTAMRATFLWHSKYKNLIAPKATDGAGKLPSW